MSDEAREAERLAQERHAARRAKDFARADGLREQISQLGYDVKDTAAGFELHPRPIFETIDPANIQEPGVSLAASIHLLYEGHRGDLQRFLSGLKEAKAGSFEVVVTDNASGDGPWLESLENVTVLHFKTEWGWAEARNAAARASRGAVVAFADLSVEPQGDILTPLIGALSEASVGVCGPWGLRSADMREFAESPGPEVDAIEGYLFATRRDVFRETGFDPWFRWYRHADLDLSFRIRSRGLSARVVPVPARRHEHRGWSSVPEPERSARSRRNFYRFLDRWKSRTDLLQANFPT